MLRGPLLLAVALFAGACGAPGPRIHHLADASDRGGPRLLCVVAHPDDEIAFAGTLYKTAVLLGGVCDVLVITNGEGGFKYATLAERVYGLELTDEEVGREHLPAIRERELVAGCRLLGVREVVLLGQRDHRYTQDRTEVLGPGAEVWDLPAVRAALQGRLASESYDAVLTLAPTPTTHGHHQAATLLALEAVSKTPEERRPAVLCVRLAPADEPLPEAPELVDEPLVRLRPAPPVVLDRTQPLGHAGRLNYRIVADWAIAEHKSQGTMQLAAGQGDRECYFLFAVTPPRAETRVRELFEELDAARFPVREYAETAGANAGP